MIGCNFFSPPYVKKTFSCIYCEVNMNKLEVNFTTIPIESYISFQSFKLGVGCIQFPVNVLYPFPSQRPKLQAFQG